MANAIKIQNKKHGNTFNVRVDNFFTTRGA